MFMSKHVTSISLLLWQTLASLNLASCLSVEYTNGYTIYSRSSLVSLERHKESSLPFCVCLYNTMIWRCRDTSMSVQCSPTCAQHVMSSLCLAMKEFLYKWFYNRRDLSLDFICVIKTVHLHLCTLFSKLVFTFTGNYNYRKGHSESIVTTDVCRCDQQPQDVQALTSMFAHAFTEMTVRRSNLVFWLWSSVIRDQLKLKKSLRCSALCD